MMNQLPQYRNIIRNHLAFPGIILMAALLFTCATPSIIVTQHQRKGDQLFNEHRYEEAAEHYLQMIEASKKLGIYRNIPAETAVRRKTANCFEMSGDYPSALMHVREAMALDSLENNTLNLIEDYRQEGRIYVYMGAYTRGIVSLEKALSLSRVMRNTLKDDRKLAIADTYLALGQLYSATGRLNDALTYTSDALALFSQAGDKRGEMEALLNLGSVWSDLGDHSKAIEYISISREIAAAGKMGLFRHHQLIASVMNASGRYDEAVRNQEIALADADKFGIKGQVIWATIGMGDIYRSLGDNKRAETWYLEAQRIKDTESIHSGSLKASIDLRMGEIVEAGNYFASERLLTGDGITSLRLAEMKIANNEPDSAELYLNRAIGAFRTAGNTHGLSTCMVLKGRILAGMEKHDAAMQLLDSALLWREFPENIWQAYYYKGILLENLNRINDAADSYRNAISVIEDVRSNLSLQESRSIFLDTKREVYDRLIRLLIKLNKPDEAFICSESARARAFYEMLAGRRINFGGSAQGDLIALEQDKRMEIQKLQRLLQGTREIIEPGTTGSNSDRKSVREALTRANNDYQGILERIKTAHPEYAELIAVKPATQEDIRLHIDTTTAAIAYWISGDEAYAWLISTSGTTIRLLNGNRESVNLLVEAAIDAVRSLSPESDYLLGELYEILLGPFEDLIANYQKLVIIPNGPLHFLPFQVLTRPDGQPLVMTHHIVYAPSAAVFALSHERLPGKGTSFLGAALSDISIGGSAGLPGTEDEVRRIVEIFPESRYAVGNESSETFVKEHAPSANILHFATHGIYNRQNPLYSHLLFPPSEHDDGRLNVYEVFEMNLDASLVTLSACETGLGDLSLGDELTGLSRAFLYAGAGAVIVSMWPVADYPTALLMSHFYSHITELPLLEALTMAQREIIKEYPQPLYWAPFILVGNGNLMTY
jgi:CHAT domain-containing protein